jgi:HK97 family phage prohead protease
MELETRAEAETEDSYIIEFDKSEEPEMASEEEEERSMVDPDYSKRSMYMDAAPINEDERRVSMALSSEEPVERSFGVEILEHSDEAIDLSFLASGRAPLLLDHDPQKQVGVIESVDLDGSARRLRATVRFGKNGLAREAFDDVVDGIRANVSIGYAINKMERQDKDKYVAKSWRPVEASLVSIPADVSVGVGRSSEPTPEPVTITVREETPMTNEIDVAAIELEARKAAQKDAAQIVELGARHNQSDMAKRAISDGRSVAEFRGELLDVIGS